MELGQILPWDLMREKWPVEVATEWRFFRKPHVDRMGKKTMTTDWVDDFLSNLGYEFDAGNRLVDFCQLNDLDKLEGILLLGSPNLPVAQSWCVKWDSLLPAGLTAGLYVKISAAWMQQVTMSQWSWRSPAQLSIHVLCSGLVGVDFFTWLAHSLPNSLWFLLISWMWNWLNYFNCFAWSLDSKTLQNTFCSSLW